MSSMSEAWIPFQPAIEDPSKAWPDSNLSMVNCFTGTEKLAKASLDAGFYLSFSGVVTFKNADPLRAIAKSAPRDRVLVETDCPYLTPVPYRGKRNEPAYVMETVKTLAALWGMSIDDVKRTTGENAARLFRTTSRATSGDARR